MSLQQKNAKQLRTYQPSPAELQAYHQQMRPIEVLLQDVTDTYNVGSMFRLADAMGVAKLWLAGKTEVPPNPRIAKAAVGLDRWVEWEYVSDTAAWMSQYRQTKPEMQVVAIEQSQHSLAYQNWQPQMPILLLAGNETTGLPSETLKLADQVVELPMYGVNISMNVIMAVAVMLAKTL